MLIQHADGVPLLENCKEDVLVEMLSIARSGATVLRVGLDIAPKVVSTGRPGHLEIHTLRHGHGYEVLPHFVFQECLHLHDSAAKMLASPAGVVQRRFGTTN